MMCPHDVSQQPAQLFHWLITQPFATLASVHRVTYPTQLSICIIRLFWTQIILYRLCSCLDNISSSSLHLTTAYCSWLFHDKMRRLVPRFLACACQEAASFCFASPLALLPTCLPRGRRSQHHKSALFQLLSQHPLSLSTSPHLCGAASCSLRACTAIWYHTSSRDWTPLLHGYCWWRKPMLSWARSCHLVPL